MHKVVERQKSSIGGATGGTGTGNASGDDDFFRIKTDGEPVAAGTPAGPQTEEEKRETE